VRQDRVGAAGEEHFESVIARDQWDQHAGSDQWRRDIDATSDALLEHLP
jgi:hypothetical protein